MADTITDKYGYPFDSLNGDRKMSAASWRKMLCELFTDGIFSTDDFYVQANNSMQITVSSGNALIRGAFFPSSEEKTLNIDSSDGIYDRYDAIALEFNASERRVSLKVVKGGTDGKSPSPKRTDSIYQLFAAIIHVRRGITSLVQNDVNDTRGDSRYCDYVTSKGLQGILLDEMKPLRKEFERLQNTVDTLDSEIQWSGWVSCGRNGCNVDLSYRYNEALKLVELRWDGVINGTIWNNSMGYMWEGFPTDKTPTENTLVPVQTQSNDLTLRFYPVASDITSNHWTLTAYHGDVSSGYICGSHIYSYKK